jgi:hypothetical protein
MGDADTNDSIPHDSTNFSRAGKNATTAGAAGSQNALATIDIRVQVFIAEFAVRVVAFQQFPILGQLRIE